MSDNIKLPPMPKPHTPPVFATAANTPSVKAGYELGGYEKTPPLFDEHQLEAYAREAVRLNAQAVTDTREMFNAGWCAAARFCDREDVVYDGLVGPGGCPAFEVAYRAALSAAPQPAASAEPSEVDRNEYRAMVAAMEQIDPATLPGLTAAQRCALGRFAKPVVSVGDALSYVHLVPDHCDRVVWRNRYLHLSAAQDAPTECEVPKELT